MAGEPVAALQQAVLEGSGPASARIAELWWLMLGIAGVVYLLVLGGLAFALLRRRQRDEPTAERKGWISIVLSGAVVPTLLLAALYVYVTDVYADVAAEAVEGDLTIEVTGHRWWWRVQYLSDDPREMVETANEIHIPAGRRVLVRLVSRDVIHSFWPPSLNGKIDLVPGRTNLTWLEADTPGVYRGQCAEYCGLQHTRMAFLVVAQEPAAFEAWLRDQREPAVAPADSLAAAGLAAFEQKPCGVCHRIRGTNARGTVAPDLTHLAGRQTIAAGTVPNTRGHLGGWISNPQALKPGSLMPRVALSPGEFHAMLHYLESLR